MSSETGGRVFRVDRKNSLDDIFKDLQDEMRTQYSIAYTSPHSAKDSSYHKIEIKVANKDYKVQARKGYYAMPQDN
jgi:VWFA-related protein